MLSRVPNSAVPGLAGHLHGHVDEVVRVAQRHGVARRDPHGAQGGLRRGQLADEVRLELLDDLAVGPDDLAHDLRPIELAAVRESRVRVDELDRGHDVVALADPRLVGLALEHRLSERVHLPLVVGDDPGDLAREVDARRGAEPVLARPIREPVGAEHARDLEEERVRRVAHPAVDVAQAEALVVPVVEPRPAEGQEAAGLELGGRGDLLVGEPAGAGDELEGRARWEVALHGLVRERLVLVVDERLEVLRRDPAREQVVVVARQADHRENLAGLRVHHEEHAALQAGRAHAPLERRGGFLLDRPVDRQRERRPGHGLLGRPQHLDVAAGRVALDELLPVRAAQLRLERRLDAGLADQVVGQVALRLQAGEGAAVDGPGVAEDVREQRAVRVFASRLDVDVDAGEVVDGLGDDARDVLGHVLRDAHGVEARTRRRVERRQDHRRIQLEQGPKALRDLGAAAEREVGGHDLHGPRRDVAHEQPALAVVDQPTRRRDRLRDRPVRLGPRGVHLPALDLEVGEPRPEDAEHEHHHDPEGQEPDGTAITLPVRREQALVHQATRSTSRRRAAMATASGPKMAARTTSYTVDGRIVPTAAAEIGAVVRAVVVTRMSIE